MLLTQPDHADIFESAVIPPSFGGVSEPDCFGPQFSALETLFQRAIDGATKNYGDNDDADTLLISGRSGCNNDAACSECDNGGAD